MKIRLYVQIATSLAVGIFLVQTVPAQGIQDQINQQKADWGGTQQRDYLLGNSAPAPAAVPAAPTPQQQMQLQGAQMIGGYIGNQIGQALFGSPQANAAQQAAQQQAQQEQQQRALAARQLNNSGIYLLKQKNYTGAIHEFQQALAQTPNAPDILHNLALAIQTIKDTAVAAQNSGALGQLLGNAPAHAENLDFDQLTHSSAPSRNSSPLNLVNLDANTVDLRDHVTALNSLNANNDPNTVDFRGLDKNSNLTEAEKQNLNQQALQQQVSQQFDQIVSGGSYAVNFSGMGKTKSANSPRPTAQDQQKLKDELNNILGANFDGQAHN